MQESKKADSMPEIFFEAKEASQTTSKKNVVADKARIENEEFWESIGELAYHPVSGPFETD